MTVLHRSTYTKELLHSKKGHLGVITSYLQPITTLKLPLEGQLGHTRLLTLAKLL